MTELPVSQRTRLDSFYRSFPYVAGTVFFLILAIWNRSHYGQNSGEYAAWSHDLLNIKANLRVVHYHLPAWPVILAAVHAVTGHLLSDPVLHRTLSFVCWGGALLIVGRLLTLYCPKAKPIGLLLFAFWPMSTMYFVGLVASTDNLSRLVLFALLLVLLAKRWIWFTAILAIAILTHKALWPFAFLIAIVGLWKYRAPWWTVAASLLPAALYYVLVSVHLEDWHWIVQKNIEGEIAAADTTGGFHLFNGIIESFQSGKLTKNVRGAYVLFIAVASVYLTYRCLRKKQALLACLCIPVVMLAVMLNAFEVFALARFSFALVPPAALWIASSDRASAFMRKPIVYGVTALLLIASQVVWIYYVLNVFDRVGQYL